MHKVSVIVTTYNRKEFLTETINSILYQSFSDFELIVVDNFSSYNFFEHIKSFNDPRIRPFQNQNNGIIAVNRNFGIRHAVGDYVSFCDDDDIWMENKLELQLKRISETDCDFVSSNILYFSSDINEKISKSKNRQIKNLKDFIRSNQINTSTVLARKTNELHFREDKELISIEDYALWLELYIAEYKFTFIDQPLVYYRVNRLNVSQKYLNTKHLMLVYLMISIKINHPSINISFQLNQVILLNLFKFAIKKQLNS